MTSVDPGRGMTLPCGASPLGSRHSAGERVLTLPAVLEPGAVTGLCQRLEAILDDPHVTSATVDTGALCRPDITAVDALARLQLTARRRGSRLNVVQLPPEMQDLLALTGLNDVLEEDPDGT
jgi:anti-anti-sigma regulatory factor